MGKHSLLVVSRSQTAILFQLRRSWNKMAVWLRETSLLATRRRNLSSLLRSGSIVGSFVRTVWTALWHQLTASTQTAYACRRCLQDLDTGSKRLESLSRSISKLEGSLSSSGYYPLAVRTRTIFTQPFSPVPNPRSLVTTAISLASQTASSPPFFTN